MALTCPQCGADNRDSAKFCRTCAHQLVALGPSADVTLAEAQARARRRRRRARRTAAARAAAPALRLRAAWVLLSLALLIVLGALGWSRGARDRAALAHEADRVAPVPAALAAAAGPAEPPTAPALAAPESAAVARAAEAVQALQARQHALARERSAAPPDAQPRPGQTPAPAARPQRRTSAGATRTPRTTPLPGAEAQPSGLAAAGAAPPAPRAEPQRPVELCGNERFLSRALCLQRACDQPGLAGHPQCVRMRELQQALRNPDRGG